MDRYARNSIRIVLKLANSIMAMCGIAILLYSVWTIGVCLREYQKYRFPWFLWACVGIGAIFCVAACFGHTATNKRNDCLLSLYIGLMFLLLLGEILVTADVLLNDDWDKDFPKDPTERFDDFVDFADDNKEIFGFLAFLMLFSQALAFTLAMVLRTMHHNYRSFDEHEHGDQIPVLARPVGAPYVLGQPILPPQTNILGETLLDKEPYSPYTEKGNWSMSGGGSAGYPPLHPY